MTRANDPAINKLICGYRVLKMLVKAHGKVCRHNQHLLIRKSELQRAGSDAMHNSVLKKWTWADDLPAVAAPVLLVSPVHSLVPAHMQQLCTASQYMGPLLQMPKPGSTKADKKRKRMTFDSLHLEFGHDNDLESHIF